MSEMDLQLLQAQVIAQGVMLRAIARTIESPQVVRQAFSDELAKLLPTLSSETMGFVSIHANHLLLQFSRPAQPKEAKARPV
jgi:hypothetical protein